MCILELDRLKHFLTAILLCGLADVTAGGPPPHFWCTNWATWVGHTGPDKADCMGALSIVSQAADATQGVRELLPNRARAQRGLRAVRVPDKIKRDLYFATVHRIVAISIKECTRL